MMTDERMDPKVIEAAVRAYHDAYDRGLLIPDALAAAIRVADRERGLKEEYGILDGSPASGQSPTHVRLVSDWRQVERGEPDEPPPISPDSLWIGGGEDG